MEAPATGRAPRRARMANYRCCLLVPADWSFSNNKKPTAPRPINESETAAPQEGLQPRPDSRKASGRPPFGRAAARSSSCIR